MVLAMLVPSHIAVYKRTYGDNEDQKGYKNSAADSDWLGDETRMCDLL